MKILVLDNYDSFTYNIVHLVKQLGYENVAVYRNDKIGLNEVAQFDKIILSPGPGIPDEAGILKELIRNYAPTKSILGICLGQQAIGEVFGAKLINMENVFHGVATEANIAGDDPIFNGLPDRIDVGRYHSWIVDKGSLPAELVVTATDDEGNIMAIAHREYDVRGVQFHPESVLTPLGGKIIANWLSA